MTEFSDKLKGLLNPNKDKDIKFKLDKINEELEKSISITISRGYDNTQFTIPQSFRYMCKEALLSIAENLEKEGYIRNKSEGGTLVARTYKFYKLVPSTYADEPLPCYANIEDAVGIEIKLF